jgi:polynucleotide 5'-kinase involved in rRNA processing
MSGRSAVPALDSEHRLIEFAASCRHDPLRFVLAAYPWGERDGPLERHSGPDKWQAEVLAHIRDNLGMGRPLRIAIAGGVGPGKSALMAWIVN